MIRVRAFARADAPRLADIFDEAVRRGAASAYSAAERAAWASRRQEPPAWQDRLGGQITLVGERDGRVQGFVTLGHDGHLDLLYVAPEAMGTGLAAALHDRMLAEAQARGLPVLTTEASHLARRFLVRQGWQETAAQQVAIVDQRLANFRMTKRVAPPHRREPSR